MNAAPPQSPSVPPSGALVYEASGLKKEFEEGQVQALRGADFQVAEGEFVAIVGPSGCGKTTLLHMLGALEEPSAGTLLYRGQPLGGVQEASTYRAREIGFVFQAFHLLPTFTALENVQFPMFEGDGRSASEKESVAAELLKTVGLGHRLHHLPSKLSGGERQRVAIARSLANSPSVLLADEPTGNLDSETSEAILNLLFQLHMERRMTLVLVTHDMSIARRATRAIAVKDGRVVSTDAFQNPSL